MSDLTEVLAVADSAVTTQLADAEIAGISQQDDGSFELVVTCTGIIEGAQSGETNTPETEGSETGSDDEDTHDEQSDDTPDTPDDTGPTTWDVQGRDLGYNDLQTAAKEYLDSYPEDTSGDGLAEALNQAAEGGDDTDKAENGSEDEDDTNDTPASGGVEKEVTDDRTYWVVNGEKKTYNGLQKEVRDMDMSWPEDQSGDNLAEIVAEGVEATETTENGSEDTTETADTPDTDPSEVAHPDNAANPTRENYVAHYGVCDDPDCSYGASGEDSDYCAGCRDESKGQTDEKCYDNLSEGQKAAARDLLEENDMSLEEAVQMV